MSDPVTNLIGNAEPRGPATAAFQSAKAPLADLFANVLDKTAFADQMLSQSELGLARAAERDNEARPDTYHADQDRADADRADTATADAGETDDQPHDDESAESESQAEEQPQDDAADSQQAASPAAANDLPDQGAAAADHRQYGLTVQPNELSGVVLQSMTEGPAGGQARADTAVSPEQAIEQALANAADGKATGAAAASAKATNANDPALANAGQKIGQPGSDAQNPTDPLGKFGGGVDLEKTTLLSEAQKQTLSAAQSNVKPGAVAPERQPLNGGAANLPQDMAAADPNKAVLSVEERILLGRANSQRAAELHYMKNRLTAHRDAIEKVTAQSSAGSNGVPSPNSAAGANKPTIEVTTSAMPPAPAAHDGPPARPASLFNPSTFVTLPGQAGVNGSAPLISGDTVGNGIEQSTAAGDRPVMTTGTTRGLGLRPAPGQPTYQPAEQVKVHIQQMVKSGTDRMQIKLSPAALGRVEVALEMTPDKTVQAIVYAEKPETLDMLERDARVLQQAFEEAGMKFDSDGLTFKHGQSGGPETELADGSGQSENGAPADGDDADGGDTNDNEQLRRRQHDGMLDLEI